MLCTSPISWTAITALLRHLIFLASHCARFSAFSGTCSRRAPVSLICVQCGSEMRCVELHCMNCCRLGREVPLTIHRIWATAVQQALSQTRFSWAPALVICALFRHLRRSCIIDSIACEERRGQTLRTARCQEIPNCSAATTATKRLFVRRISRPIDLGGGRKGAHGTVPSQRAECVLE